MIDRHELSDFARELSLSLPVVEKDYVLGWLLAGISANEALAKYAKFSSSERRAIDRDNALRILPALARV